MYDPDGKIQDVVEGAYAFAADLDSAGHPRCEPRRSKIRF